MKVCQPDILFLASVDIERAVGGAEIEVKRLAWGFAARGYRVVLLAARHHWRPPVWSLLKAEDREIPSLWVPKPRVRLLGSLMFIAIATWYLVFRLRPRVVQTVSLWNVPTVMAILARLTGNRVIRRSVWGDVRALPAQKRRLACRARLLACRFAGMISVTNRESVRLLTDLGIDESAIVHVPIPVDTSHYRPWPGDRTTVRSSLGLDPASHYICFVGRLETVKRVDVLLRAFSHLVAKRSQCKLLIVGDGEQRRALQALAQSLGIGEQVTFAGQVKDPLQYLQASDVFVLTSETEGHSVALTEAMACGLPVVVTAVGGNKECISHRVNGFLVSSGTPAAVADAILEVLDHPAQAARVGQNARLWAVENCSLERIIDRYLELYRLA